MYENRLNQYCRLLACNQKVQEIKKNIRYNAVVIRCDVKQSILKNPRSIGIVREKAIIDLMNLYDYRVHLTNQLFTYFGVHREELPEIPLAQIVAEVNYMCNLHFN